MDVLSNIGEKVKERYVNTTVRVDWYHVVVVYDGRMFTAGQEKLVWSLETLRKRLCAYGPDASTCDCKFINEEHKSSEQTGCCELRTATMILENLTTEEYEILCKRAGLSITYND